MLNEDKYIQCLKKSERVAWILEDEVKEDAKINFELTGIPLSMLLKVDSFSQKENLIFSQLTANSYCFLFKVFEAFINWSLLEHISSFAPSNGAMARNRAILRVCDEEYKHMQLFTRFNDIFARATGVEPKYFELLPSYFANPKLMSSGAKTMVALFVEYLTLDQFKMIKQTKEEIDPLFLKVLTLHSVEEAQHIVTDELVILDIVEKLPAKEREMMIKEFLTILFLYDSILKKQDELDLYALEKLFGRSLTDKEREKLKEPHVDPARFSFAITHRNPRFQKFISQFSEQGLDLVLARAKTYDKKPELVFGASV